MCTQVRTMGKGAWLNRTTWEGALVCIQTKSVVHACVTSKLDNNNTLLTGIPPVLTSQLQRVQSTAARPIIKSKKHDHVTPILTELHWLPIHDSSIFKVFLVTYKSLDNMGSSYMRDLLTFYHPSLNHRSSSDPLTLDLQKRDWKSMMTNHSGSLRLKYGMNSHRISGLQSPSHCSSPCQRHLFRKVMEEV